MLQRVHELFQASQEYLDNFVGKSRHDIRPALKLVSYLRAWQAVYVFVFHLILTKDGFGNSE